MKRIFFLALILITSGCTTFQPIPDGYKGPTATVADSGFSVDGTTAQLFVLDEINGNRITTSFGSSAEASYGQGFALTTVIEKRQIQAKPMKVKLFGAHKTAAPIQAIQKQIAGTFYKVSGVVDFNPKPNRHYIVKGKLSEAGSSIWIEDGSTGKKVTKVVRGS